MNRYRIWAVLAALGLFFLPPLVHGDEAPDQDTSPWQQRFEQEGKWRQEGLSLIPYRSNYLMPFTYNTSPHPTSTHRTQNAEAKFQISVKVLLIDEILDRDIHLFFGYTQLSLWQAYDQAKSSPFRDTDYEPEAILTFDTQQPLRSGVFLRQTDVGVSHQSNGVSDPDSRSWNRVYARFLFDRDNWALSLKPWYRIPETSSQDDNKNIERYMGYGEGEIAFYFKKHIFTLFFRNNLRSNGNKGAIELNYSFPLTRILTGLIQYFNGYGETLADYNRPVNRLSLGIALSNWR